MEDKVFKRKYGKWIKKYEKPIIIIKERSVDPTILHASETIEQLFNKQLVKLVELFHNNRQKFKKQDLYSYSYEELAKEAKSIVSKRQEKKAQKIEGATEIYSDEQVSLYRINSYSGMNFLSKGTQWCVSNISTYYNYTLNGKIFYIIIIKNQNNVLLSRQINSKFAIIYNPKKNTIQKTVWNELDIPSRCSNIFSAKLTDLIIKDGIKAKNSFYYFGQKEYVPNAIKESLKINTKTFFPYLSLKDQNRYKEEIVAYIKKPKLLAYILSRFRIHQMLFKELVRTASKSELAALANNCPRHLIKYLPIKNSNVESILVKRAVTDLGCFQECEKLGIIHKDSQKIILTSRNTLTPNQLELFTKAIKDKFPYFIVQNEK